MPQQRHQTPDHTLGVEASILSSQVIAVRERIDSLIRGTMQLAEKLPSTNGELFPRNTEFESVEPHQLVIISEDSDTGSRLIKQLTGHDLCITGGASSTQLLTKHRYGKQLIHASHSKDSAERHHPVPLLKHVNLIVAPVIPSSSAPQQKLFTETLAKADLIFIALPAGDPSTAKSWPQLANVQESEASKILFLTSHENEDAIARIATFAREKLGREMPIFSLAGTHRRGLDALRDHVAESLLATGVGRRALDAAIERGEQALRKIEDQIENLNRKVRHQGHFLDEVERGFTAMRVSFASRLGGHMERISTVFNHEANIAQKRLKKRLHPMASIVRLFTGGRVGVQMHTVFTERIQQAVMEIATGDSEAIAAICREHYLQLCKKTKDEIGTVSDLPKDVGDTLARAQEHFLARIEHSAKRGISDLGFRNPLEKLLRRRNRSLKSFVAVALSLTFLGASSGAMGINWLASLLCMLAALFLAGALWAAWVSRRSIFLDFKQRLDEASASFANNLHFEYETAIGTLLAEYATSLKPLRAHIDRERNTMEPLSRRWQELFLGFRTLSQEL